MKDKRSVMLGSWKDPELTAALFGQFLGSAPVDPAAKLRAGCGLLFLTNGFKCGLAVELQMLSCLSRQLIWGLLF